MAEENRAARRAVGVERAKAAQKKEQVRRIPASHVCPKSLLHRFFLAHERSLKRPVVGMQAEEELARALAKIESRQHEEQARLEGGGGPAQIRTSPAVQRETSLRLATPKQQA